MENLTDTQKLILLALGGFAVLTSANVAANAIYTHSKIGIDKKPLIASAIAGIGVGFLLAKYMK